MSMVGKRAPEKISIGETLDIFYSKDGSKFKLHVGTLIATVIDLLVHVNGWSCVEASPGLMK
jgi:hypothetical protein